MILEANRMLSDWFQVATYGVNALLASTPRDAGDGQPTNLATITDETRDGNVARGELPATLPALAISVDHIKDLDGMVVVITRDGKLHVRLRVGVDNAVTEDAIRDLSYYLRTVIRSFRSFFEHADPATQRTRNGVYLETCLDMAEQIAVTKDPAGNTIISAYVLATIQLRDLAANS